MKQNLLSAAKLAAIVKDKHFGWHHDGCGLYLVGSEKFGTFSWTQRIYRYTVTGRPRDYGLGSFNLFTLQEAREAGRKVRQLASQGIDPVEHRRAQLAGAQAEARGRILFKDAAAEYIEVHSPTWKSDRHHDQWKDTLAAYVFPRLGNVPVSDIDAAAITMTLAPIWISKAVTARRVKNRVEKVCQWIATGRPLPQRTVRKIDHHAALPVEDVPAFMAQLRAREGVTARALEFLILTAARTAEVTGATWREINLDACTWTIPGHRMKIPNDHVVPLSGRAIAILEQLPRIDLHVFPGNDQHGRIGTGLLLDFIKRIYPFEVYAAPTSVPGGDKIQ
jgi:hypothetical protein